MKQLKSFFCILLVSFSLLHSKPSEAALLQLGYTTKSLIIGVVLAGGGVAGTGYAITQIKKHPVIAIGAMIFITLPAILLGSMILDEKQPIAFKALESAEAKPLGISESERLSFNAEIDAVNALSEYVLLSMEENQNVSEEFASAKWSEVKDAVSPETFNALVKVSQQLLN
jgi:hypothetical protein